MVNKPYPVDKAKPGRELDPADIPELVEMAMKSPNGRASWPPPSQSDPKRKRKAVNIGKDKMENGM